jgi:hypothetical protein
MNLGGAEARIIGSGDNISARQHEPEAGYHLEAFTRQRWRASFNDACRRMRPGDDRTSAIRRRTRRRDHHARHSDGLATKPCRLVQDPIGGGAIGSSGKRLRLDQTPSAAIRSILSLRRNRRDRKQGDNKRCSLKGLWTAESVQQTAERRRESMQNHVRTLHCMENVRPRQATRTSASLFPRGQPEALGRCTLPLSIAAPGSCIRRAFAATSQCRWSHQSSFDAIMRQASRCVEQSSPGDWKSSDSKPSHGALDETVSPVAWNQNNPGASAQNASLVPTSASVPASTGRRTRSGTREAS